MGINKRSEVVVICDCCRKDIALGAYSSEHIFPFLLLNARGFWLNWGKLEKRSEYVVCEKCVKKIRDLAKEEDRE